MKYRDILLEELKPLSYFATQDIHQIALQYGLKATTVNAYISRSLQRKDLIQLKKGLYVTSDFYERTAGDSAYQFFIANILKSPSYVSCWTALHYYNLTTEVIAGTSSVTTKGTRTYEGRAGSFRYQSISPNLFKDFVLVEGTFDFFIASPAKALFDLLYLTTHQFRGIQFSMIRGRVSDLRIDIDEMEPRQRRAFYALVKEYLSHG